MRLTFEVANNSALALNRRDAHGNVVARPGLDHLWQAVLEACIECGGAVHLDQLIDAMNSLSTPDAFMLGAVLIGFGDGLETFRAQPRRMARHEPLTLRMVHNARTTPEVARTEIIDAVEIIMEGDVRGAGDLRRGLASAQARSAPAAPANPPINPPVAPPKPAPQRIPLAGPGKRRMVLKKPG